MEASESSSAARIKALESELQGVSESFAEAKRVAMEWETTFNASRDAFWILDKDHRVLRSNRAAETIFQKPIDAMIGRMCWEIVHGTSFPIPQCPMRRARTTLRRETMELDVDDRCYQISGRLAGGVAHDFNNMLIVIIGRAELALVKAVDPHGYRVLAANRPGEALALARAHKERIDLLVTDVVMPEMNGKQLKHL